MMWEEFQSILDFREKLVYRWGQPDIYFVALLKPLTYDIKICPKEIGAARWMKIVDKIILSFHHLFFLIGRIS